MGADRLLRSAAAGICTCLTGQAAGQDQPSLSQLTADFRTVSAVVVELAPRSGDVVRRVAVSSDGRFLDIYSEPREQGEPTRLVGVVGWDGQVLIVPHGRGNYQRVEPDLAYVEFPSPINIWAAPWLWVDEIAADLTAAADINTGLRDGLAYAESAAAGWSLSWDQQGRLVRVERTRRSIDSNLPEFVLTMTYSPQSQAPPWCPATMRFEFHIDEQPQSDTVVQEYEVTALDANPADIEAALTFDPVAYNANRVDAAKGNVYAPTGEFLYNADDFLASFDRMSGARRTARVVWPWVAGAIVIGTVGVALHRARRSRSEAAK